MPNPVTTLRYIGFAEGVSYLVLLGIAMPLKYLAGQPLAVQVVGGLHGLLFVLYVLAVLVAAYWRGWSIGWVIVALGASLIPAGPFLIDGVLRKEEAGRVSPDGAAQTHN